METSEILKKVRQIEIKTRGLSNNIFAGQYHSAFKGKMCIRDSNNALLMLRDLLK